MSLLSRLEGVRDKGNGQYVARCPAHEDRSPSLSVRVESDGTILLHCFAGCTPLEVLHAVGLELPDLFPDEVGYQPRKPHWDARTFLELCEVEAWNVLAIAEDVKAGKPISDHDQRLLRNCTLKFSRIVEVMNARR